MSRHSARSPSKSHMWMHCYGALAQPENQVDGGSSTFADNGTASHTLGAWALETGYDCHEYPFKNISVNGVDYPVDEERIDFVQAYVDDVRRRAMGGTLWVEYRVDLRRYLGMETCAACEGTGRHPTVMLECKTCKGTGETPQGGTSDAVIILPEKKTIIVGDLKYGTGEKVYAAYFLPDGSREINTQGGNYLLGVLGDAELMGYDIEKVIFIVYQMRLNHIDEFEITADELRQFGVLVQQAIALNDEALVLGPDDPKLNDYLHPGKDTCRWCNAKARCNKLAAFVAEEVRMDFEDTTGEPLAVPVGTEHLSRAHAALPLIQQWVKAVNSAIWNGVNNGDEIIGPDGKPLKFVEGKEGKRTWEKGKEEEAEGLLVGQLGEQAYKPREILTAPAAGKLLDKKKTKTLWEEVFAPLIKRAAGPPQLALGSDPRPAYGKKADASEFEDEDIDITE